MDAVTKGVGAAVPIIERRLELLPQFFSEDNFRYLVFNELHKAEVDVVRVSLEHPHPADLRAKIDTVILDAKGEPETAIEFKYHRNNTISDNLPRTMHAGKLIADFARLRDFPNVHRFIAYLTDDEMFQYFNNPKNGLNWLFSRSEQEISDAKLPSAKIFRENADDWSFPVRAQVAGRWDVGNDHKLVVWRVEASRQGEWRARRGGNIRLAAKGRGGRARGAKGIEGSDMDAVTQGISGAIPLLERRLGLAAPFGEDDFRHLAVSEIVRAGVDVMRVAHGYPRQEERATPEYSQPRDLREKIDAVILDAAGAPETAIEFKYHRGNRSGSNLPRTMFAGELIAEFAKLRDFFPNDQQVRRFVMYLTDGEMFRYFNNPNNGLSRLLAPMEQEISDRSLPRTKTLRRHAGDWRAPVRTRVKCVWDLGSNHWLVVWQVLS